MLNPLADALAQVATSSTRIYLAMQVSLQLHNAGL